MAIQRPSRLWTTQPTPGGETMPVQGFPGLHICVARVPIYALDVETLVARSRLEPDSQNDTAKISAAIEALVDDFTEGKLIAASEG